MAYPAPRRVEGEVRSAFAAQRLALLEEIINTCIVNEQSEIFKTENFI
jgi:hypothetical protein